MLFLPKEQMGWNMEHGRRGKNAYAHFIPFINN
jgi:hypothetical protein